MIEAGFAALIQSGLPSGVNVYAVQLLQNTISKTSGVRSAVCYRSILSTPLYELDGQNALTKWEVQIDCHGLEMKDCITAAKAINTLLSGGWHGTLSDADNTVVQGIYRMPGTVDGYADISQTFVRSLEYKVVYSEQ